jgi:hypothetical protein
MAIITRLYFFGDYRTSFKSLTAFLRPRSSLKAKLEVRRWDYLFRALLHWLLDMTGWIFAFNSEAEAWPRQCTSVKLLIKAFCQARLSLWSRAIKRSRQPASLS